MTVSFGVSASSRGQAFDYQKVFLGADEALYEAKHSSDRVAAASRPLEPVGR